MLIALCGALVVLTSFREVQLGSNALSGTIPKSFAALKSLDVIRNVLTGNATAFVDVFGPQSLVYNCFDPAVPPSNPSC
jgi:hypothetical protein